MQTENEILVLVFFGILAMLVMVFAILIFVVMYHKRGAQNKLEIEKIKTIQKEELINRIYDAQEEERKRISVNLHDEVGSTLSSVNLMIGRIRLNSNEECAKLAVQAGEQLDIVMAEVRNIIQNMSPSVVERFGFYESVQEICNRISASGMMNAEIESKFEFSVSDKSLELKLYRIIQELTNNAVKHSGAKNLIIIFKENNGKFFMIVCDDGVGINTDESGKAKGLGLNNIYNQIEIIGGSFSIDNNKDGGGTNAQVILPSDKIVKTGKL